MNYLSLNSIYTLRKHFEKKLTPFSLQIVDLGNLEWIYILEDSLVLLLQLNIYSLPVCSHAADDFSCNIGGPHIESPIYSEPHNSFVIEELTPNEINFKFNRVSFISETKKLFSSSNLNLNIRYIKFKGYHSPYWCPEAKTSAKRIDQLLPELQLRSRYNAWTGDLYNYIVYEAEDPHGRFHYAASYTRTSPKSYVTKMCKEYIRTGTFSNDNTRRNYSWDFDNALRSWKGISKQKQLEEHLRYFVIQTFQKEFDDTWKYADRLLEMAQSGAFSGLERYSCIQPSNRWISEEFVYKLTKKMYKAYNVIYQHRPFFLRSSIGGQMSYDVYISGLKIAIEYQGKQHFQPIAFFGGTEGFENLQRRDAEKLELSKQNGVRLVYINYWEEVNEQLIRTRIEEILTT